MQTQTEHGPAGDRPGASGADGRHRAGDEREPIVQNGRLVGAVTHVLVNDPTRGYGIFAQTMLEQAEIAAQRAQDTESSK